MNETMRQIHAAANAGHGQEYLGDFLYLFSVGGIMGLLIIGGTILVFWFLIAFLTTDYNDDEYEDDEDE